MKGRNEVGVDGEGRGNAGREEITRNKGNFFFPVQCRVPQLVLYIFEPMESSAVFDNLRIILTFHQQHYENSACNSSGLV